MVFCRSCGKEMVDGTEICDTCKTLLKGEVLSYNIDKPSFWWNVLSFFFPMMGLSIFLCLDGDNSDDKAVNCGISAFIGFGGRVLVYVLWSMGIIQKILQAILISYFSNIAMVMNIIDFFK